MLATDWAADAVELLRENAARNGIALRAERVRWDAPEPLLRGAPWDLVLGADLLYEARNAEQLAALLPRLGAEALLAEPGRPFAEASWRSPRRGGRRPALPHPASRLRATASTRRAGSGR